MGDSGNLGILLRDAFRGVYDHNHHIGPFHGGHGTDNAVALQFFLYLALAAQAGRIYEYIRGAFMDNLRIHRIPGSACYIRHNDAVLAHKLINNGRLSHIRLAYHSNSRTLVLFFLHLLRVKVLHHFVQQITNSQPRSSRYSDRLSDSQIVKLVDVIAVLGNAVHLVHSQHHRLVGFAQQISHL